MQQFSQHPDKMDQIMDFVIKKVEHFTEFKTKRTLEREVRPQIERFIC